MSKLEEIRRILDRSGDVVWSEQSTRRENLRYAGTYYDMVGLQVASRDPILESITLQEFSERLTGELVPLGPTNVAKCYEYEESRYDVVKTAAVYFTETIDEPGDDYGLERRIAVSIYPCEVMSEDLGVRATVDLSHYECPEPCAQGKQCMFAAKSEGFFFEVSRR